MSSALYTNEVLDLIEKATGQEKLKLIYEYGSKHPFNMIFSLNFNHKIRLDLPEGMPPYRRDEVTHFDLFPSTLAKEIRRLMPLRIVVGGKKLPRMQREGIFTQVLESIAPKEADVIIFAKDHALTELYPSITPELMASVFPFYVVAKDA